MKTGQTLSLQQKQRLALTPGIRTSLSFLRLPMLGLIDAIEAEAAENPYLLHDGLRSCGTTVAGSAYEVALNTTAEVPSLIADLLQQIGAMPLPAPVRAVAEYLAGDLREDGYLDTPLEELQEAIGVPMALIENGLAALQSCEPAGVGARTVAECLILQLADLGVERSLAEKIIRVLDQFANEDWRSLGRILALDPSEVPHLARLVKRLKPHPISPPVVRENYLMADIILTRDGAGAHGVELGLNVSRHVTLNRSLIEATGSTGKDGVFAADKLARAEHLLSALYFRGKTLLLVGMALVQRQHRFFDVGPDQLIPMSRSMLAAQLGLHGSTIGRAVAGKALEAGGRLYPLAMFFSSALATASPQPITAFAVRRKIVEMIATERGDAPISDVAICAALRATGVDIARRTVAKYRGCMRIPSSSVRRSRTTAQLLRAPQSSGNVIARD